MQELVLDAADFGSLEARRRWFLIAHPPGLALAASDLERAPGTTPALAEVLDAVTDDDPAWRDVGYLKSKACRDAENGSGFAMQWIEPGATRIPTLRKGYHKGGSSDPRLKHPTRHELSRLLTATEHARIKAIPADLMAGLSSTATHQACGQSVDTRLVAAIGRWIGAALLAMKKPGVTPVQPIRCDNRVAA